MGYQRYITINAEAKNKGRVEETPGIAAPTANKASILDPHPLHIPDRIPHRSSRKTTNHT